jgi:hypothetical protein
MGPLRSESCFMVNFLVLAQAKTTEREYINKGFGILFYYRLIGCGSASTGKLCICTFYTQSLSPKLTCCRRVCWTCPPLQSRPLQGGSPPPSSAAQVSGSCNSTNGRPALFKTTTNGSSSTKDQINQRPAVRSAACI